MPDKQQRNRRQFTQEFKRDAVELVPTTGRPIAEIARELGIYDSTLGNWVKQDRIDRGEREGLTSDERARLGELERDNARLRMERDLLKRTVAFWVNRDVDTVSRYRCVDAQKATGFPVAAACQAAGVTRSASYAWTAGAAQAAGERQREQARLVAEIRRIHARSKGTYGAPRVHAELRRRGQAVNHKRVERLMPIHGIVGYRPAGGAA
jgi:transposase